MSRISQSFYVNGLGCATACTPWEVFRNEARSWMEREYLANLLNLSDGDLGRALALSGLSRSRLYHLLKQYGLTLS